LLAFGLEGSQEQWMASLKSPWTQFFMILRTKYSITSPGYILGFYAATIDSVSLRVASIISADFVAQWILD
jgi:hypothetical protein